MAGAAVSLLVANGAASVGLALYLLRRDAALSLNRSAWRLHAALLRDILRVGLPASMSPVLSNASIAVATAFVGSFGTAALAGYGVAARLEYILVPIAFGFGTALTAMVATNMGAGNLPRAVREFGASYLHIVGTFYGLYGLGLALFFASQGAGHMFWPLVGSAARLVIVALGGWICVYWLQTSASGVFIVVAVSLAVYGLVIAGAIKFGSWTR